MTRLNFSLTQLEYVMALQRHGHFAKAAEACHVTQPTLSMQIQKLEEELGVTIFDRSKKPILLTKAGEKLIEQVQAILFEARKIESIITSTNNEPAQGLLTVGIIPTIAPYLIPKLLPVLDKMFPNIELQILELQTHRIVESLQADELDVGILATPLNIQNLFEKPLYYETFSVLCKKNHELTNLKKINHNKLKTNDIWLLTEGHCLRNQILDVCSIKSDKHEKRKYRFESGSLETLKKLISSYGGYTLLPQLAADEIDQNTVLLPFERPIPAREVGIVFHRKHYKLKLIDSLAEAVMTSVPKHILNTRQKDLEVLPVEG